MSDEELDLLDLDTLLAALQRRFDVTVFAAYKQVNPTESYHMVRHSGGHYPVLGLLQQSSHDLLRQPTTPVDDEDV